jgi:probable F420-dependent oxidoreductase
MTKPFRFGVQVSQMGASSSWRDKAHKLEDLGYSTLFMPDHFGEELAPLPAIAMAAAYTSTLRVGSLVFDNDYKHPAILAKEIATIDALCGGRVEFGLGAGWMRSDYDALGLPYDPPAVRVDRFEEALQIVKGCFTGEKFTHRGEHYRVTDYASYPVPAQRPGPPIVIGGGGKRVLSLAAQHADIVGINPNLRDGEINAASAADSLAEQTDKKIQWVRDAAGARLDDLEIQMRFFVTRVTEDRAGMANAIAPMFGVEPDAALESGAVCVGSENEIIEQLQQRRERWGLSYVVVGDDNVDEFAPIVAKLTGS